MRDLKVPLLRTTFKNGEYAMTKKPKDTIVNNRDSETGRFVTPEYAKKHPKTTETEHNPKPKPKPKPPTKPKKP